MSPWLGWHWRSTLAVGALLSAATAIYESWPVARDRPIKGFVQVAQIAVYILGAVFVISALLARSPVVLLTGFGAMTAILLLVFRDTILSLVASIQLTTLDMVRVGDWIEMPQYDADGDVVDIALHTIRVQNWDKTITTIPTHKLDQRVVQELARHAGFGWAPDQARNKYRRQFGKVPDR